MAYGKLYEWRVRVGGLTNTGDRYDVALVVVAASIGACAEFLRECGCLPDSCDTLSCELIKLSGNVAPTILEMQPQ